MLPVLATITVDGLDQLPGAAGGGVLEALIPILAVTLSLGMPIIIVFLVLWFKSRKQKLQNEVILKLAERGQPIPPEMFAEPMGRARSKSDLSSGLSLIGVGIGVAVGLYVAGGQEAAGFALIPFFIGLARLISWKIEQGANKSP